RSRRRTDCRPTSALAERTCAPPTSPSPSTARWPSAAGTWRDCACRSISRRHLPSGPARCDPTRASYGCVVNSRGVPGEDQVLFTLGKTGERPIHIVYRIEADRVRIVCLEQTVLDPKRADVFDQAPPLEPEAGIEVGLEIFAGAPLQFIGVK